MEILVAKFGLGKNPLQKLFLANIIMWFVGILFPLQASIVLLVFGLFIYMVLVPFVEAAEQTILQKVVPLAKQGRVFGFAQTLETLATPIMALTIGPLAHFVFIPFMTTGQGVELIGEWFGIGVNRGIGLVFMTSSFVGLTVTIFAINSRVYRLLVKSYQQ